MCAALQTELHVDCVIIGAGVIGLAIGRRLAQRGREVVVVEAAPAIGTGISSRNSAVIHAGIYYPPGSLKARLCVSGRELLYRYCAERSVPHRRIGKLIVAHDAAELEILDRYRRQAQACGVTDLQLLDAAAAQALEPALACAGALCSPSTGILDPHALMLALQADLEAAGGIVALNSPVGRIHRRGDGFELTLTGEERPAIACRQLVNAAGLHAQSVARAIDVLPVERIPDRYLAIGHYYGLSGAAPFSRLIYPVAEEGGLGIHLTLDLAGAARFGPDIRWIDRIDHGFDDSARERFITAIRRWYPGLDATRLQPAWTGIRPKLSGPGQPAADFMIQGPAAHGVGGLVNLYGIESPGLTAALAIAEEAAALL